MQAGDQCRASEKQNAGVVLYAVRKNLLCKIYNFEKCILSKTALTFYVQFVILIT